MNIDKLREWHQGLTLPADIVNGHVNFWPLQGFAPTDTRVDLVVRYRSKSTAQQTSKQIANSLIELFQAAGYTVTDIQVSRAYRLVPYGYSSSATFHVRNIVLCETVELR
jgi:hypothetical protein